MHDEDRPGTLAYQIRWGLPIDTTLIDPAHRRLMAAGYNRPDGHCSECDAEYYTEGDETTECEDCRREDDNE
jgi:hypothetical protein